MAKKKKLTHQMIKILGKLPKMKSGRYTKTSEQTIVFLYRSGYSPSGLASNTTMTSGRINELAMQYFPRKVKADILKKDVDEHRRSNGQIDLFDARTTGILIHSHLVHKEPMRAISAYFEINHTTFRLMVKNYRDVYEDLMRFPHGFRVSKVNKRRTNDGTRIRRSA